VDLFDSTFETMAGFADYVRRTRPSLVGLYCNLMTKQNVLAMIRLCQASGARVVLGGPEPPAYALEYLAAGADVIVTGEGELTLAELIPHLARYGLNGLDGIRGYYSATRRAPSSAPRPDRKSPTCRPSPGRTGGD